MISLLFQRVVSGCQEPFLRGVVGHSEDQGQFRVSESSAEQDFGEMRIHQLLRLKQRYRDE